MGLLKFALVCIDFLAWPVIALGYPLFASIRAVETGSKHQMEKLVIYWIIFSLISLFEFAFVEIIERIPFWSSIRLIAILWLVIPRFDGAYLAYQILVRPVLYVNTQEVIDKFYKPKEEKPIKRETFLDVAEKYIKQNGSEALEKLIVSKIECQECENSQRDSQVLEPDVKTAAAASKQPKEPGAAQHKNVSSEATEKTAATEAGQVRYAESNTAASVPKKTDATAKVKETTPLEMSAGNRHPLTPPFKKPHQEWRCKVTATSEKTLNAHLQGRQHKSEWESLKSSELGANDIGPSPSITGNSNKFGEGSQQKSLEKTRERVQFEAPKDQQKQGKPTQYGGANQMFKHYCSICDVKMVSDIDLASHIKGRRHLNNM